MAFSSNPRIPQEGLQLLVDAADHSSYPQLREVEVMVVGGGGGGGMDMGGGGGGGGVVYNPSYKVSPGQIISVTVGAGGWGAPAGNGGVRGDGVGPQPSSHQFTVPATNGGNSAFGSLVALGGGKGGSSYFQYTPDNGIGATGSSGGGNSGYTAGSTTIAPQGTVGQGFKGGNAGGGSYYSGGGGGAGGPGADGPNPAHGGDGIQIPRMSPHWFGGGGGGSSYSGDKGGNGGKGGGGGAAARYGTQGFGDTNGINAGANGGLGDNQPGGGAGANTGGGGGGGSHYNVNNQGGNGGSGIVIVRYNGPQAASGGTYSFSNGVSYHTFTSNGEFVPNNGYTVYDLSPNKYALSVGSIDSSKLSGGVFDFSNDTDANLNLSVTNFTTLDNLTMESVFSPSGTHLNYHGALISSGDWNVNHWALAINQPNDGIVTRRPYIGVIPYTFVVGQWYHLVWRRSGGVSNFFVNGVQVGGDQTGSQNDRPLVSNAGNTMIGRETYAGGFFNFNGKISHTKIYNRALTTAEILSNYRNLGKRVP